MDHLHLIAVLEPLHGPVRTVAAEPAPGARDLCPDFYLHGLTSNSSHLFVTP
uniref:Transposase IS200-like domain-containing protein n=1 Tax=Streptomyces kanamyceticus TaxID=1967 RepID=E9KT93_STRKN|nr:hypothetical protein Tcs_SK_009 [Streptomyces kanamyceticus]